MNIEDDMEYPLITVLVCTYNKFEYLSGTINSILQQEYPCIELIVADDASKDFPKVQIEKYINTQRKENIVDFIVCSNLENLGTVRNINNGVKQASGKYIIFIAGDDEFYDSTVIKKVVYEAEKRKSGLLITTRLVCDENLGPMYFLPYRKSVKKIHKLNNNIQQYESFISSMDYHMASGSVFCLKRSIFEDIGRYDERYCLWEDGPFLEKYLWNNKLEFAYDIISIRYRTGGISDKKKVNPLLKKDEDLYRVTDRIKHIDEVSRCTKVYIKMSDCVDKRNIIALLVLGITHPVCSIKKIVYRIRLAVYKKIDEKNISKESIKYASNKIYVSTTW